MKRLQDQMIETDWAEKVRTYDMNVSEDDLSVNADTNKNSNERNHLLIIYLDQSLIAKSHVKFTTLKVEEES